MAKKHTYEEESLSPEIDKDFFSKLKTQLQEEASSIQPSQRLLDRLQMIPQNQPLPPPKHQQIFRWLGSFAGACTVLMFLFLSQPIQQETQRTKPRPNPTKPHAPPPLHRENALTAPKGPIILVAKGSLWTPFFARGNQPQPTPRVLRDGTVLYPNDLVQWSYRLGNPMFVFLVGMNQEGELYPMLPPKESSEALRIKAGKGALPQDNGQRRSFRLDRYLGKERFFVFQSSRPFSFQEIKNFLIPRWIKENKDIKKISIDSKRWSIYSVFFIKKERL